MKVEAFKFPGWANGKKLRRKQWDRNIYMHLVNGLWLDESRNEATNGMIRSLFMFNDWEVYEEKKKMWRHEYWFQWSSHTVWTKEELVTEEDWNTFKGERMKHIKSELIEWEE